MEETAFVSREEKFAHLPRVPTVQMPFSEDCRNGDFDSYPVVSLTLEHFVLGAVHGLALWPLLEIKSYYPREFQEKFEKKWQVVLDFLVEMEFQD